MKNELSYPSWWRSPVAWSCLGIAASYQLVLIRSPVWSVGDLFQAMILPAYWFFTLYSAPYCLVAHGIFFLFCLWWEETRHPFFYVLIPLSAWSCTAFSMGVAIGLGYSLNTTPAILWIGLAANVLLLFLCGWWRRTQSSILYAWLPLALLLGSPFGVAFLIQ